MPTVITTKISENRGKPRIWFEGRKIEREGIKPGDKFDIEVRDTNILLMIRPAGKYSVSKRSERYRAGFSLPLIELRGDVVSNTFGEVEKIKILIQRGRIIIAVHQSEEAKVRRAKALIDKLEKGEPLDVCSLFAGGGILDSAIHTGLANAGIGSTTKLMSELESVYMESCLANAPELFDQNSILINGPIEDINMSSGVPEVQLICLGLPCTGASKSGLTKNKLERAEQHEEAGAMFYYFLRILELCNPAMLIFENVTEFSSTAGMDIIRNVLKHLGYIMMERTLGGNEFGALENRKRLCLVAIDSSVQKQCLFNLNEVQPIAVKEAFVSDILEDIPDDDESYREVAYLAAKEARDLAQGKGFKRQLLNGSDASNYGCVGKLYHKHRSTEPRIICPADPKKSRLLTPIEHARGKKVPERLINGLSNRRAHEILGQAITFTAFEAVALELGKTLKTLINNKLVSSETA